MLTTKAVARGLLLLLPLAAGCLSDSARPNTLPRRSTSTASDGSPTRNSAWASSTPAYRSPYLTPRAPTPSSASKGLTASGDSQSAQATSPQPRVPDHTQVAAASAGGFEPMAEGPALDGDAKPEAKPEAKSETPAEPKAEGKPEPKPEAKPQPAQPTQAVETSRAKIPPLPGSEADPPPSPGTSRTPPAPAATDDPSLPPPIPSVVKPAPAKPVTSEADALPQLRTLHKKAATQFAEIDSYIARLRRREQINGKDKPEELMLFKFRKTPWSVYFKWLGIEGHNRECVYVKGRYGNMINTLLAEGDVPLMPAGKRISLAPDSALVRARSRHSITDAGIGEMIDKFGQVLDALEQGDKRYGTMKYLGQLRRPEFEKPHLAVEQVIPPGAESALPQGGSRLWLFDPDNNLPVLLVTMDHTNHEVEYYCYDRLQYPVKLDEDDFIPDRLWKQK
jgi:hypothetical protein